MAAGDNMFSTYGRVLVLLSGPPDPTPWSQFVQRAAPLNLAIDCFCIGSLIRSLLGTKDFKLEEFVCVTELGGHVLMQKDVDAELGSNMIQVCRSDARWSRTFRVMRPALKSGPRASWPTQSLAQAMPPEKLCWFLLSPPRTRCFSISIGWYRDLTAE